MSICHLPSDVKRNWHLNDVPSSLLYTQNNKHHYVKLMQDGLILQFTCNYSLVFPPGGTILGTSMPAPLLPLLLLLNHSQCASPIWPRTERENKLSVRNNILIPILYYSTHCTDCCLTTIFTAPTHTQYTHPPVHMYNKHTGVLVITTVNIVRWPWPSMWQSRIKVKYWILYRAPPHLKCCITELSLRAGLIRASEMFIHLWSRCEPPL